MIDYISRKLLKREEYYKYGELSPSLEETYFDLYNLIAGGSKRVVLLGDAGYGKSTELEAATYKFIEEENQNFIPVYIELNTYVDEELMDYVRSKIGEGSESLLNYDKSKLIFLFDEFDQVMNKEIATRKIKSFIENYDKSTFIIACRTNFYSGQFNDFNTFVLFPFSSTDIKDYTKKLLNVDSDAFLKQLEECSLFELAKNPFFLNHLIEIYKENKKIPKNRSDIFSRIVSLAIENDERKLADKYDLKQTYPAAEITKDLKYISLVMETLQRNFVTVAEFNQIVPNNNKSQIISELSLIKKSFFKEGDAYQFRHNNFQEYLAAKMLADRSLGTILEFASFRSVIKRRISWVERLIVLLEYVELKPLGIRINKFMTLFSNLMRYEKIEKIIPSWVNTIAFLCQLRQENDLLKYLMRNEPELTLKFEMSRIDEDKRGEIFKTIFRKYTERKIWLDRDKINYEEMANFGNTNGIYDFLMEYACSKEHFVHRYNAIQMMGRMKGIGNESLCNLLIKYIKDENENENVRHICFYALSWLGLATQDTIDSLKHLKDLNNDWILSGLYYLIAESKYTDQYMDILLSGIPKTRRWRYKSSESRLMDEGWNLVRGIEKVQSVEGAKKIIRYFIENPRDLHEFYIERVIERIVSNVVVAYNLDKSIYTDMKELAISADRNHLNKVLTKIQVFFQNTNTALDLFKEIYGKGMKDNHNLLASMADEQCVNFLISEYLKGKLSDTNIEVFINFLWTRNRDHYDDLLRIINEKTGKFLPSPPRDYAKEQEEEMKRKIEIIFDRGEFLKEVDKIFHEIGKEELGVEDLEEISLTSDDDRRFNEFVLIKIINHFEQDKNKKWKLAELKEDINKWNYEWFTISHLFNLLHDGSKINLSKEQEDRIKDFCMKNFNTINFREALKPQENGAITRPRRLAIILWYFLRKYDLKYPESVLLDMLSFDWIEGDYFEGDHFVGVDYLESKIPLEKLKGRILGNLNLGIAIDQVLKNHINYCKKHQMHEAKEQLYKVIENPEIGIDNRLLALEAIADFPNSTLFLEKLLDNSELKLFSKAAEIYMMRNSEKCEQKLADKLSSQDENRALEASKLLIGKQNMKAIKYYADFIKKTKKIEADMRDENLLHKITTVAALPVLFDLLKFSYSHKKEIQQSVFNRLDSIVISVLKNIAIQNFSNFTQVIKALQKFIREYQSKFEDINFLNVARDNIEKAFLINCTSGLTIDEAISKVQRIS